MSARATAGRGYLPVMPLLTFRMLSMTGFGQGRARDQRGEVVVQIAAVNNRGCQVQVRGELRDLALEERIRQEVRNTLQRGSVTVQVVWSGLAAQGDAAGLAAAWRELAALAHGLGAPVPTLEGVARLLPQHTAAPLPEDLLVQALGQALVALRGERAREGAALAAACRAQATALRGVLARLQQRARPRLEAYRISLARRLAEALPGVVLPAEQLARELALQAERLDVTEELVRLAAHLDALDGLLAGGDEALGRKLEFLLQEIARELNTTGAKANDAALAEAVLEGRQLADQLKEQAANLA